MSFVVWTLAAAGVVAFATSAAVGPIALGLRRTGPRLHPADRARLWQLVAALPAAAASVVVVAALVPAVLGTDHCGAHGMHHPHLCPTHTAGLPAPIPLVLGALLLLRSVHAGVRAARLALRARRITAGLETAPGFEPGSPAVVPSTDRFAFVTGFLRPRVYVSRGLLSAAGRGEIDLDAVVAHEQAHVRGRDPLRNLAARLALSFHLPGVGAAIARRLARAVESAADEQAAMRLGDRLRVADALVRMARLRTAPPAGALGFGGDDLEGRVRELLADHPADRPAPTGPALLATVLLGCGAMLFAPAVHHGLETVMGWLS